MRFGPVIGPVVPAAGIAVRITWPGVVLGVYSQRCRASATVRSPRGAVKRISKEVGRRRNSFPRVVLGGPPRGMLITWHEGSAKGCAQSEGYAAWVAVG